MQLSVRLHLIPYWTLSTKGSSIKNAIIAYTIELLPMHVPLSTNDPQRTRDRTRFDTPIRCVLSSTHDNPFPPPAFSLSQMSKNALRVAGSIKEEKNAWQKRRRIFVSQKMDLRKADSTAV